MLFCHITSHVEGEKHGDLLRQKGGTAFPTLLWLDKEGETLTKQQGFSLDGFRSTGEALVAFEKLKAKEDRTPKEEAQLVLARMDIGQMDLEEATAARDVIKMGDKDLLPKYEEALLALEIKTKLQGIESQEEADAVTAHFAQMIKDDRVPTKKGIPTAQFWMAASQHAYTEKDAKTFARCVKGIKEALDHDPQHKRVYDQLDERLAELEKK